MLAIAIMFRWAVCNLGLHCAKVHIVAHCDNAGDCYSLSSCTSSCLVCRTLAICFYRYTTSLDLVWFPSWIMGSRNSLADAASRVSKTSLIESIYPET